MTDQLPQIETAHVAAAIFAEKPPQTANNKDVQRYLKIFQDQGGKDLFKQIADSEEEKSFDFSLVAKVVGENRRRIAEINQILQNPNLTSQEKDALAKEKKLLETRNREVGLLIKIYEGNLGQLTKEEQKIIGERLAKIPGFCVALAFELRKKPQEVVDGLRDGSLFQDKKVFGVLEAILTSPAIRNFIGERLARRSFDSNEFFLLEEAIFKLSQEIASEESKIIIEKNKYIQAKNWFGQLSHQQKSDYNRYHSLIQEAQELIQLLNQQMIRIPHLSSNPTSAEINKILTLLSTIKQSLSQLTSSQSPKISLIQLNLGNLESNLTTLQQLNRRCSNYDKYLIYLQADQKLAEISLEENKLLESKKQLAQLESQRRKFLEDYERHLLSSFRGAFGDYWNKVILERSQFLAQFDFEEKKKQEQEAKTQEERFKAFFERYFKLILFRYEKVTLPGGQVTWRIKGFNDPFIKNAIKNELRQRSPVSMLRFMFNSVISSIDKLPPNYQQEIRNALGGLGFIDRSGAINLGKIEDFFATHQDFLFQLACEQVPQLVGIGWARGYWFDRLRFKKHEVAYLKSVYTPEFFAKALQGKSEFQDLVDSELGKGVLDLTSERLEPQIRRILGKDWTEGIIKLLKILAIIFGISILGGGIVAGISAFK